jgi:hypothetical protein
MSVSSKEIEQKLNKYFAYAKQKKITRKEFNYKYYEIVKYCKKYNISCSKEKRMDGLEKDGGRSPYKFFEDIHYYSMKEFFSFKNYFIDTFKRKGIILEWGPQNEEDIGKIVLKASPQPDFFINKLGKEKQWIDSKTSSFRDIIILKYNNLVSYKKYNALLFFTTIDRCFFFSSGYIKFLTTLTPKPCLNHNQTKHIYNGKKCIEISNRKDAHISVQKFQNDLRTEDWYKNEKLPIWKRKLKKYN